MFCKEDKVFIVGSGWSLEGFEWSKLANCKTVAVNAAMCFVPNYDVGVAMDVEEYVRNPDLHYRLPFMTKPIVTHHKSALEIPFETIIMPSTGAEGFEFEHNKIRTAGNSGYGAINAAYHLGARNMYLLGFDLSAKCEGQKHFYEWYLPPGEHPDFVYLNYFYNTMYEAIKDTDITITNCSEHSVIDIFPKIRLQDVRFD
jgi:hypothetical protein